MGRWRAPARVVVATAALGALLGLAACGTPAGSAAAPATTSGPDVVTVVTTSPSPTSPASQAPAVVPSDGPSSPADPSPSPTPEPLPDGGSAACPSSTGASLAHAPGTGRTVALTFDDGPGPSTGAVLDVLHRYGVRATFFLVGERAQADPATVRRIAADGHLVGNHSWDHTYPRDVAWTRSHVEQQIHRTASTLTGITGRPTCWFRPPGGFLTNVASSAARQRVRVALWSIDPRDWRIEQQSSAYSVAAQGIVARATTVGEDRHPIVLLHDGGGHRGATAAALPRIIQWYAGHGYRFVRLDGR